MSVRRRSPRSRLRPSSPAGARIWSIVLIALSAVGIVHCLTQFAQGRYLTGRGSTRTVRDHWERYGEGAFSGDSPVYLFFASVLVAALLFAILGALGRFRSHGARFAPLAIGTIGLGSVASIALIASYALSGVPYRNFQPMGADALLYPLVALVPAIGLFGVVAVTVGSLRTPRSADR